MTVIIEKSPAEGKVAAPPSKSMAHRMLLGAGLSKATSVVKGLAFSQDILATIDCLQALGAQITIKGDTATVTGCNPALAQNALLPCRESGSTLRFFLPLCLLSPHQNRLIGSERLLERPQSVYEDLCQKQNLLFEKSTAGITVQGALTLGKYTIPGNISSQFATGLLYALSLLPKSSTLTLLPPIESRSYLELTRKALAAFGANITWQSDTTLHIPGGGLAPAHVTVEGDYSNAAFLDALTLMGGQVEVMGLDPNSLQGDKVYKIDFDKIKGGTPIISLADCPDLGPIYMALAAAFQGAVFTHTARLKIKESDRGAAMATELAKFGVKVTVEENTITVPGGQLQPPNCVLYGHNDHRIVMALATLCTKTGGVIKDAQAVSKSFPDYFETLSHLGIVWKEDANGTE